MAKSTKYPSKKSYSFLMPIPCIKIKNNRSVLCSCCNNSLYLITKKKIVRSYFVILGHQTDYIIIVVYDK